MISTLRIQTLEIDLIEKIKAAIKKRAEAKAKRMFLKRPRGFQNANRRYLNQGFFGAANIQWRLFGCASVTVGNQAQPSEGEYSLGAVSNVTVRRTMQMFSRNSDRKFSAARKGTSS